MGVWIETILNIQTLRFAKSHPVWVCGLKRPPYDSAAVQLMSHPVWVCGLKHVSYVQNPLTHQSHPVWVCGLKPNTGATQATMKKSHPVWVCGLKHFAVDSLDLIVSHTLYGCVD